MTPIEIAIATAVWGATGWLIKDKLTSIQTSITQISVKTDNIKDSLGDFRVRVSSDFVTKEDCHNCPKG